MARRRFGWDGAKAARNLRDHGVSFEEAVTAFDDPNRLIELDLKHSEFEDREIVIGFSERARLLMVVTTERHEAIRLISARRATKAETGRYAEQNLG